MIIRRLADSAIRKLFPARMELLDLKTVHAQNLQQIQENTQLSFEQWVERVKEKYRLAMQCELNLEKPTKFTEKIQYRKLFEHNPLYSQLADKYAVREWVKQRIGEEYLIPLLGAWDKAEKIDFDALPNNFVLKTNHACGTNIIIRDKKCINRKQIIEQLNYWLKYPYWAISGEFHYKDIKPMILAEEYISQMDGNLFDYKIHCFNSVPTYIQVIGDRDIDRHTGKQANYDFAWKRLPWISETYPAYSTELEKPILLDELYRVSKTLCEGFGYVRVDLYIIDNQIKFGEMTFTPGNGIFPYRGTWTEELDLKYGKMMVLDNGFR